MADSPLDEIDEHQWDEACRRSDAIRKFLKRSPDDSSTGGAPRLAAELGVSRATAYRLIKRFRADDTVMSLRKTIAGFYLKQNRPTFTRLVRDVQIRCISAGLKPPHRRTIKARLDDIDLQKRAKRRGEKTLIKATTPTPRCI